MSRPLVNPGQLFWTGQHWMVYLRQPGTEEDSGRVSIWHTHYCEAGEGTVAYVDIPGDPGLRAVCTDNRDLATFMDAWVRTLPGPYALDTIVDAVIRRKGEILSSPSWVIQAEHDLIVAAWSELQAPVILEAPAPKFLEDQDVYSYLFFTEGGTITLNGQTVEGRPYTRETWKSSIGGDRSSCVIALSETFIQIPDGSSP